MNKVSVVGLAGLSFSDSTVANHMLGSHPQVYGGSEPYRPVDPDPARHGGCP